VIANFFDNPLTLRVYVVVKAIDLMEKCLAFSPKRRLDVSEALQHPYLQVGWRGGKAYKPGLKCYFQPYHDAEDEPTAEPLDPTFFDFDIGEPLSKEELKGKHKSA
jgi:mitogen-activated protein kinase 1/3